MESGNDDDRGDRVNLATASSTTAATGGRDRQNDDDDIDGRLVEIDVKKILSFCLRVGMKRRRRRRRRR